MAIKKKEKEKEVVVEEKPKGVVLTDGEVKSIIAGLTSRNVSDDDREVIKSFLEKNIK